MEFKSYFAVLVLIVGVWVTTCTGDIWSLCGSPRDHLNVTSVKIIPDPPVKGQNITVSVSGILDETVTGGSAHVLLTWNTKIVFLNETVKLCDIAKGAGVNCPIEKGPHSITVTQKLPDALLKGTYDAHLLAWDQNGQNITCVNVEFKLA